MLNLVEYDVLYINLIGYIVNIITLRVVIRLFVFAIRSSSCFLEVGDLMEQKKKKAMAGLSERRGRGGWRNRSSDSNL